MATFHLENVIKISTVGNIAIGKVTSGSIKTGMKAKLQGGAVTVKSIELNRERVEEAKSGVSYGMCLENSDFNVLKGLVGKDIEFKK